MPQHSEPEKGQNTADNASRAAVSPAPTWYVYILNCRDNTLYTGITTEPSRRLREHNAGGSQGARYTRARLPVRLAYLENTTSRSLATRRELEIKSLNRKQKLRLIQQFAQTIEPDESL